MHFSVVVISMNSIVLMPRAKAVKLPAYRALFPSSSCIHKVTSLTIIDLRSSDTNSLGVVGDAHI